MQISGFDIAYFGPPLPFLTFGALSGGMNTNDRWWLYPVLYCRIANDGDAPVAGRVLRLYIKYYSYYSGLPSVSYEDLPKIDLAPGSGFDLEYTAAHAAFTKGAINYVWLEDTGTGRTTNVIAYDLRGAP
jgi:hypothetical protein